MKMIYKKPVRSEIREYDWRPTFCKLTAPGCVPGLSFEMSLAAAQALPERAEWPHATGRLDAMFDAGADPRFILSEIVRCRVSPALFGKVYERAPYLSRSILAALMWHRRAEPDRTDQLNVYISAGRQARNRVLAHRLLKDLE